MLPRRWYGAVLLTAAVGFGTVYARGPDAPVPYLPPMPFGGNRLPPPSRADLPTELPPVRPVGSLPEPASVPSDVEAAAQKKWAVAAAPALAPPTTVAVVSLEVVGPATLDQRQPLAYEIVVRNPGTVAVADVQVQDGLSAGARYLESDPPTEVRNGRMLWSLGTLEAGTERRIKVKVQPSEAGDTGAQPTVRYATQNGLRTQVVRPPLVVTQAAPETAQRGQNVPIEIRVTNNTAEPLQHVVLRAQIPPGLQFLQGNVVEADIGTLAAKETKSVHLNAQAVQPGPAVSEVTAQAAGGLSARSESTVLIQEAGLLAHLDGPGPVTVGGELSLRIEVTNGGSKPVRGVGLLLTLPDGIEPLSPSTGGTVDPTNRSIVGWALGALGNGERQTVTLKAKARVAGDWICRATVRADGLPGTTTTATLHVEPAPSLGLEIGGRDDAIDTGAETVYEMRVLNEGGVPCPGVRLVALVPDGFQVVHAEGPTAAVIHQQRVQFDPLPQLPGRTEVLYRLRLRGMLVGDWRVRVRVEADPLANALLRETSVRVKAGGSVVAPPVNSGPPG